VVVLPDPLSPTNPRDSPTAKSKPMSSTALTYRTGLGRKPWLITGKCLLNPVTERSGSVFPGVFIERRRGAWAAHQAAPACRSVADFSKQRARSPAHPDARVS